MKEGWRMVKMGEVCTFNKEQGLFSGLKYVGMEHIESGTGIVVGGLNSTEVKSNTFKFYRGDVLYGRLRPYLKKVFVAEHEGCCSTEIFPIKTTLNPYFLKYWFLSEEVTIKINKTCGGCRMPRANMNEVLTFNISFPPLEEQRRIVSILDASFEKIDALKKNAEENLKNAKALFQQVLAQELKPKEGWVEKKLGEVYDVRDGTHDSPKYHSDGYPFVTSKNLVNGIIDMNNVQFISKEDYDKINERSKVDKGDILFAMIGSNLGHPAIVDFDPHFAIKNVALFKVPSNQLNRYLLYLLSSDMIMDRMNKNSNGSSQPFVSLKFLRNFEISLPSLSEQHRIVQTLDTLSEKCRRLEQVAQQTICECDALKQSILRQAFSGEL